MSKRSLPEAFPISDHPTYHDQLTWYEDRIRQLEAFSVDMIHDRISLADRCK